jgi:ATP-GRASP peptide maturase of grasp-with-spasm system
VVRINHDDIIEIMTFRSSGNNTYFEFRCNGYNVASTDIYSYWYRRGSINMRYPTLQNSEKVTESNNLFSAYTDYHNKEWEHVHDFIHFLLSRLSIRRINSFNDLKTNKLVNLEIARDAGLNVPETLLSNDIATIRSFFAINERVITKPVRFPGKSFSVPGFHCSFSQSTSLIDLPMIERYLVKNTNYFQPTYFQQYINKVFEIRCFYLLDTFFSMAIFSQQNDKTKVDYRNYDDSIPNRTVPFLLPKDVETKLSKLMATLSLDTGSIDLIFDGTEYYFLEVNTVGQFSNLSKVCNYNLEQKIAYELSR